MAASHRPGAVRTGPEPTEEGEALSQNAIPPDVRRFVAEQITSADQLDILLLMHAQPERSWTARQVSEAVFTVPTLATMRLEELVARGLLTSTGGPDPAYRYEPVSGELRDRLDGLASAYRANRVGVIQLVFQKPADPLQSFSDAFRLRRDE